MNTKVSKTVTIGVTGIKRILFNAYVAFTGEVNKAFNNAEKTKEWLVKE